MIRRISQWLKAEGEPWSVGTLRYSNAGLIVLFGLLLLGDFAWSMRDRSVMPMAQWYLHHLQVSDLLYALLISSIPALLLLALGPVVSVMSDRHRGPRGRRIPVLLITTPIGAAGMIGMGLTPLIAGEAHRLVVEHGLAETLPALGNPRIVALVCFAIFWAAFEFATTAGQAVFGGLVNDVVPAPVLGRFYGLFRAVSLIDGVIFNALILGRVPEHYTLIFVVIGLFYGLVFFWICCRIREGTYPPPESSGPGVGLGGNFFRGCRTYFRECFFHPYYLMIFVMLMMAALAFIPVNVFSIPFAQSLGLSMDAYGKMVALTFVISFCLAYVLGWLADRFHPLRVAIATLMLYAGVTLAGSFFATTPGAFMVIWTLHSVLAGTYLTGAASLTLRLFPRSKFAQFMSASGICLGLGSMFLSPALGALIGWSGKDYLLTFRTGFVITLIALGASWFVYRGFIKLGGPKNYIAPEVS